jgi:hypothetical protein
VKYPYTWLRLRGMLQRAGNCTHDQSTNSIITKAPFDLPASVVHQVSVLGKEKKFPVFTLRLSMALEELLLRMGNSVRGAIIIQYWHG